MLEKVRTTFAGLQETKRDITEVHKYLNNMYTVDNKGITPQPTEVIIS